jgi:oxygen-independent coproporphyrinogen-3 oxidase
VHYPWLKTVRSIYLGGGTPSLFSIHYWTTLFEQLRSIFHFHPQIEITMEVSPKTSQAFLMAFQAIGINRFSVGVQSFNDATLSLLGREHSAAQSYQILNDLCSMQNIRINIDLIYGLKAQSAEDVAADLRTALSFPISHLSWYELMIEPNTKFAKHPDIKGDDNHLSLCEQQGSLLLEDRWEHYEISAYCKNKDYSQHNTLYWTYGDYLGLGAGAHSKITLKPLNTTRRFYKTRYPQDYVKSQREISDNSANEPLDYLLGRLRLFRPLTLSECTVLSPHAQNLVKTWLKEYPDPRMIVSTSEGDFNLTDLGRRSLNTLLEQFMDFQAKQRCD